MMAAEVPNWPRPRIRPTAVRDGLNRFLLIDAMCTKKKTGPLRLMRLASGSRAQLASARRTARGFEFRLVRTGPTLKLDLGVGSSVVEFPVSQQKMSAIARLLRIPLHLDLECAKHVDWEEMQRVEEFLDSVTIGPRQKSPGKAAFINRVLPRLQELKCHAYFVKRLPPLALEKLVLRDERANYLDFESLSRHRIQRLDVDRWAVNTRLPPDRVLSPTVKSLSLVTAFSRYPWHLDSDAVKTFCGRLPALEELHVESNLHNPARDFVEYFSELWTECVDFRERLNVPGLKRIFVTTKLKFSFYSGDFDFDWMRKVRAKEPFDRATFWTDPVNEHERMSLVVRYDWPDGPKPTVFHIEAECYPRGKPEEKEPSDSSDDEATANPADRFDRFEEFRRVMFPD
ncbi:hypothetical protein M3Y99_01662300 [Aphelenchoides fujianensis]|nr:hypothetical protein M3Y99_01662300 [Aphelenchoides fujianensis]